MSQVPPPMSAPPMGYQNPPPAKPQGLAVGALICGILSLVLFCFWFVSVPLGIVAIILGVMGKGKAARGVLLAGASPAGRGRAARGRRATHARTIHTAVATSAAAITRLKLRSRWPCDNQPRSAAPTQA